MALLRNILREGYRLSRKHAAEELDPLVESRVQGIQGLEGSEVSVFLEEVCRRANAELHRRRAGGDPGCHRSR